MKKWIYISEVAGYVGEEIILKGWLAGRRSSGKIHFLNLRDGTGFIQGVMSNKDVAAEVFELGDHLSQESAVQVTGEVRRDSRSRSGFELGITNLEIIHL